MQDDSSEDVRKEALRLQSELRPAGALDRIEQTLRAGTLSEKQNALGTLGNVSDSAADMILNAWMDRLLAGDVPPELQLDVIDAAAKREDPALKTKIEAFQAKASEAGELGRFAVTLYGGNKEEGRRIFFERPEASCVRCHKIEGENSEGGEVGPELTGIASKRSREYLLESVLYPNKQIAEGFESVLVTTRDGTVFAGTVKSEDAKTIHLLSPEDGDVTLEKDQITSRQRGLSSMPEGMDKLLSNQDIRNLMEYLSTLK